MDQSELPKEIQECLGPNEEICHKLDRFEIGPKDCLVITDSRVIFVERKLLGRYELIDVPFHRLNVAYYFKGKIHDHVDILSDDGDKIVVNHLKKGPAQEVIEALKNSLNDIAVDPVSIKKKKSFMSEEWVLHKPKEMRSRAVHRNIATEQSMASNSNDPIAKLKKLGELKELGVITEDEFEEKKQVLMSQI